LLGIRNLQKRFGYGGGKGIGKGTKTGGVGFSQGIQQYRGKKTQRMFFANGPGRGGGFFFVQKRESSANLKFVEIEGGGDSALPVWGGKEKLLFFALAEGRKGKTTEWGMVKGKTLPGKEREPTGEVGGGKTQKGGSQFQAREHAQGVLLVGLGPKRITGENYQGYKELKGGQTFHKKTT